MDYENFKEIIERQDEGKSNPCCEKGTDSGLW